MAVSDGGGIYNGIGVGVDVEARMGAKCLGVSASTVTGIWYQLST